MIELNTSRRLKMSISFDELTGKKPQQQPPQQQGGFRPQQQMPSQQLAAKRQAVQQQPAPTVDFDDDLAF